MRDIFFNQKREKYTSGSWRKKIDIEQEPTLQLLFATVARTEKKSRFKY